jgi:hypothetical protein
VVGVVYLLMGGGGGHLSAPRVHHHPGPGLRGAGPRGGSRAGDESLEDLIAASAGAEGDFPASIPILPLEKKG